MMRIIGCLFMMAMVFLYPRETADAARSALRIFGSDIVPSLFPYMILTRVLTSRIAVNQRSSIFLSALLGLVGGSPSGASILQGIVSRYSIPKCTLYALCAFTGTISPAFLIHTVGGWFAHPDMILALLFCHFAGALLAAAMIYALYRHDQSTAFCQINESSTANDSVIPACTQSILSIGGCLVFFSVASSMIRLLLPQLNDMWMSATHAVLEIAGGLKSLSMCTGKSETVTAVLVAVSCGFSGISIITQNALFLRPLGITMINLTGFALLRALLCGILMAFSLYFF